MRIPKHFRTVNRYYVVSNKGEDLQCDLNARTNNTDDIIEFINLIQATNNSKTEL